MKSKTILLLLFTCMLSFLSCNSSRFSNKYAQVAMTNFEEEIEVTQNLVFTFNKDVMTSDSLLNRWLDASYITFSPKVEGKFKWNSTRELVFSPVSQFSPATTFKAEITNKALQFSKGEKLGGNTTFLFHTPFLELENAESYWAQSQGNADKPSLQTDIRFNMDVNPGEVSKLLTVKVNGKEVKYKVLSTVPGPEMTLNVEDVTASREKVQLKLEIKKIPDIMEEKRFVFKSSVPPLSEINVTGIRSDHDGVNGKIYISFSQPVRDIDLAGYIKVVPEVPIEVFGDGRGITITGSQFDPQQKYQVSVKEGLPGYFGGTLEKVFRQTVSFGKLMPEIAFENEKGLFLGSKGQRNLAVRIVGVDKIKVSVIKVFENNIMHLLQRGQSYGYHYEENPDSEWGGEYYDYRYFETEDLGEVVYEKDYDVSRLKDYGYAKLLHIDFEDKLQDKSGIYIIKVQDGDRYYITDSRIVSLSDLGLIVKEDKDKVYCFVNSISEAKPLRGAEINFISKSNQLIGEAKTDNEGVAVFDKTKQSFAFQAGMISARLENDYNFLVFREHRIDPARFDVGGKYTKDKPYDAFMYAERDIYRPGETIHMAGIVRTPDGQLSGQMPVKVVFTLPTGRELSSMRILLDDQGAFELSCPIPSSSITGSYTADLYSGADQLIASKRFSVEEFMPDRIKVEAGLNKDKFTEGEKVDATVKASNYFGPPAANRSYEMEMTLRQGVFTPKGFEDYIFSQRLQSEFMSVVRNGVTDAEGNAAQSYDIPALYAGYGKLDGKVMVTVFDESGRPVNRLKSFEVNTQQVYLGIRSGEEYVGTDKALRLPLIALSSNHKPVKQNATITIVKHTWFTALQNYEGQFRYESQQKEELIESRNIIVNGQQSYYNFIPPASGEYEIRLSLPGSRNYVSRDFYAYRFGDTYSTSFEVNNEGTIDIAFDKEKYEKGEKAKVLLKLPFEGRVLVSVERDKLIDHFYINSDKKAASFTITTGEAHLPNAYVSATLIKPHTPGGIPLTVAHGFASFSVDDPDKKLTVKIEAAEKSFSKTTQTIKVKTRPNTWFTLAAVDEGILALNDFPTPDPYGYFFQKRALEVESYNIYPYLFPEITAKGGDMAAEAGKRINPLTNKRVKLVSYWSGKQRTDALGNATLTIDIPQFSGKLRLMAVACYGNKYGFAEKFMTVADPIVISSGLPRFTSPGDQLEVPVTIANTTNKTLTGTISAAANGIYKSTDNTPRTISIRANSEMQAIFNIEAAAAPGTGTVIFSVNSGGKTYTEETTLSSRPAAPLTKSSGTGEVAAGKKLTLQTGNNFLPGTYSRRLIVSNSPMIRYSRSLDMLVNYPHGCIEQTISSAFPQLYYADISRALQKNENQTTSASQNVQAAIQKIHGMQLSNGAVSYWPGANTDSWWGTAYAAHFLYEAHRAGYDVNREYLKKALAYLRDKLKTKETEWYYYNGGKKKEIARKEIAYSLYVLALAGKAEKPTMNYYKANPALLSADSRCLLACAYALTGDMKRYRETIPANLNEEVADDEGFSSSLYSALRDKALMLNTLLAADPSSKQINYLAKQVGEALQKAPYLNTQEAAFGFMAMGKLAKITSNNNVSATIFCNGKKVGDYSGKDMVVSGNKIREGNIEIIAKGKGKLYYFWETEGVPVTGIAKAEDSFLEVRKKIFNRNRQLIGNQVKQNDLVVVEISIRSKMGEVPNVAISDLLPAGLEIENSRIREIPDLEWVKDAAEYDYLDIRDDRINIFTTATTKVKKYYYLARAVSSGKFTMGPIGADAMYKGEYHSYFGGGTLTVIRPQPVKPL